MKKINFALKELHQLLSSRKLILIFFNIMFLNFISCKKEDLRVGIPSDNIRPAGDFIENNYDFKLMYEAIKYTELLETFNAPGPITVFGISNGAFNALGINSVIDIYKLNKDSLKRVLQYHILNDRQLRTSDIPTQATDLKYKTVSGDEILLSSLDKQFYFDGASIANPNITVSNGIFHVLNKAMKFESNLTVQSYLENKPKYSILVAGLKKFGIWDELKKEGPFTIFAPTNKAFEKNGVNIETVNSWKVEDYHKRIFNCYILFNKSFFISDHYIFQKRGSGYRYEYKYKDDNWILQFGHTLSSPWIDIYPALETLLSPAPDKALIGKNSISFYSTNSNVADFDFRVANGIIHDIPELLVKPSDALLNP